MNIKLQNIRGQCLKVYHNLFNNFKYKYDFLTRPPTCVMEDFELYKDSFYLTMS